MKRRDFLIASGGIAAAGLPVLARAATPCPPPSFTVSGQTLTTACPSSSGTYTTDFPLTESAISEGGRWLNGFTDGVSFKDVRTANGRAFASGINNAYDDSWALLKSPTIPDDQFVEVVIYRNPAYAHPGSSHEVQLLLRGNMDRNAGPYYSPLIEVLIPMDATFGQIAYQDGQIGGYHLLTVAGPGWQPLKTGDVVRAQIVGSSITVRINGAIGMTATESRRPTGKPGIGFFVRPGGIPENYCISRFTCGPAT